MSRIERIKEIIKEYPNFGKRVGFKMCVVDELHDMVEAKKKNNSYSGYFVAKVDKEVKLPF